MQPVKIETREHLLTALAEAAELEHTLMCQYLYATFSIKHLPSDGLSAAELSRTKRWRRELLDICIQEMGHLALVCNLTTAIGGTVKLTRADFPVRSGLFPAEFVLALTPFSLETLDHFIFLERSDEMQVEDGKVAEAVPYERAKAKGRLHSHVGDYSTVGQLYEAILGGLEHLGESVGESTLFCGSKSLQLGPAQVELEGLEIIDSIAKSKSAIALIVEQGEGSRATANSHFAKFTELRAQLSQSLTANPEFRPARGVVKNPVMIKPVHPAGKTWVCHADAAEVLDFANALYSFMIRLLLQTYSMEGRSENSKKVLVDSAFTVMHLLANVSDILTDLPAENDGDEDTKAGLSFDLSRHLSPFELKSEKLLLVERAKQLTDGAMGLTRFPGFSKIAGSLKSVYLQLGTI